MPALARRFLTLLCLSAQVMATPGVESLSFRPSRGPFTQSLFPEQALIIAPPQFHRPLLMSAESTITRLFPGRRPAFAGNGASDSNEPVPPELLDVVDALRSLQGRLIKEIYRTVDLVDPLI